MRRYIISLVFLYFICLSAYGQRSIGLYERRMDSIAMVDFSERFKMSEDRGGVQLYYPVKWIKISFSRSGNSGVFGKMNFNNLSTGGPFINDLTASDVFGLYSYDVRVRVYMTNRFSFVTRVVATGFAVGSYNYSWGLRYRF